MNSFAMREQIGPRIDGSMPRVLHQQFRSVVARPIGRQKNWCDRKMSLPWRFIVGCDRSRRFHFLSVHFLTFHPLSGASHGDYPLPSHRMLTAIAAAADAA